jgi:DNA polymerase-1
MTPVIRDVAEACAALEPYWGPVSLDLETSGPRPHHDSIAVVSLCLYPPVGPVPIVLHLPDGVIPTALARQLERADLALVWHNGVMFDAIFLVRAGVNIWRTCHVDTYLGAQVLLGGQKYDAQGKAISAEYAEEVRHRLGIRLPANKRQKQRQNWAGRLYLDADDVAYCVRDVLYLVPLALAQWEGATPQQRHAMRLEQELADVMTYVSINGLPVDRGRLAAARAQYEREMEEPKARLKELLGDVNPNAPAQVRDAINKRYGTALTSLKKEIVLEALVSGAPWAEAAEPYRAYQKTVAIKRQIKLDAIGDDGRMHAQFKQVGARSGRMSATRPNVQQLPRLIRSAFAAEDLVFGAYDFSQLETALAAVVASDRQLQEAVHSSDVYRAMGARIFGSTLEDVTDEQRAVMKIFVLGSQYGGGPDVLRKNMYAHGRALSTAEAEDFLAAYRRSFPGIERMRKRAHSIADHAKRRRRPVAVELASGMQRVYWPSEVTGNSLLATRVSGLAAVGLKLGLLLLKDAGLVPYLVNVVHDELDIVCSPKKAAQLTSAVLDCMIEGMQRVAPEAHIVAEPHIGPTWDKKDGDIALEPGADDDASEEAC